LDCLFDGFRARTSRKGYFVSRQGRWQDAEDLFYECSSLRRGDVQALPNSGSLDEVPDDTVQEIRIVAKDMHPEPI